MKERCPGWGAGKAWQPQPPHALAPRVPILLLMCSPRTGRCVLGQDIFSGTPCLSLCPDPAFTTRGVCVFKNKSRSGASHSCNQRRHLPSAQTSFPPSLARSPSTPISTFNRSSTSWNFKRRQSNHDNRDQTYTLLSLGNQLEYRPPRPLVVIFKHTRVAFTAI